MIFDHIYCWCHFNFLLKYSVIPHLRLPETRSLPNCSVTGVRCWLFPDSSNPAVRACLCSCRVTKETHFVLSSRGLRTGTEAPQEPLGQVLTAPSWARHWPRAHSSECPNSCWTSGHSDQSASVRGIEQGSGTFFLKLPSKTLGLFHRQKILCSKFFPGKMAFFSSFASLQMILESKHTEGRKILVTPSISWFLSKEDLRFDFKISTRKVDRGGSVSARLPSDWNFPDPEGVPAPKRICIFALGV